MRIGSVPFLNARPLVHGLPDVVEDVPSRLAERFRRGEVDVALLPSFEALRRPECPIVPGGAVASPGPVDSVLLFSHGPLAEARTVLLDESSLTSAALARVLLAERSGDGVVFGPCPPEVDPRTAEADAVLLIGDPAMTAPRDGLLVTDLAVAWRELTGLPFCFAVWLARDEEIARAAGPILDASRARGLARRREIAESASAELSLPADYLLLYLTERITYELGGPERDALGEFARLCRRHGVL
jgi:chorismate dehydratase